VDDWPLALCDVRTLESADLVPNDLVYRDTAIENYQVYFNPKQKWYYLSQQTENEAWVFVQADSEARGIFGEFIA
jgi:hypothetical protein